MSNTPKGLGRDEYREQMRPKAEEMVNKWIARGESPSMSVDTILDEWWVLYAKMQSPL
jgi:hypothetical protein